MDSESGRSLHALAPALSLRVALADSLDLELDWPFGFTTVSSELTEAQDELVSGNPFLAAYYVDRQRSGYLRVGFGVAPPVLSVDDLDQIFTVILPLYMRGLWDAWLYAPEHLSLVVPLQLESRRGALLLGVDGAAAVMIPTSDVESDDTDLLLQLAGLIGAKKEAVSAGVRLQMAWVATADRDNAQLALVPFVQGDLDNAFVYLRILVNLDEPAGVIGDGGDVWALYLGGGGRF
jgi:hypothetical protein